MERKSKKTVSTILTVAALAGMMVFPVQAETSAQADLIYNFEDGTLQGWEKGKSHAQATVSVETEEGNKYLRIATTEGTGWLLDRTVNVTPDAYINTNYSLPADSSVMLSADFRYSDTWLSGEALDKGRTLLTYSNQLYINAYADEIPQNSGNVYIPWEVRQTDDGFRTYSEKSTGTVAWDSTRYQGASKNIYTVSPDNWYTVKTLFKTNSEGVAEKISYYLYDSNGNLLVSSKDETIKNDSLKISSIADLSAAMPASSSKQDLIPNGTFDIDNVSIKNVTGKNTVSIVEDEFKAESQEVRLQLAEKPDDVSLLNSITCVNALNSENIEISASFDGENKQIVIVPENPLPAGEYKITLPATLTVAGETPDKTEFTFYVYGSADLSYDFEDGTMQGWEKGNSHAQATVSVETEEGNKYLRIATTEGTAWLLDRKVNTTPDAYINTNYSLPADSSVMLSADFRYSDTWLSQTAIDKGRTLLTYSNQLYINAYADEIPQNSGNVYMPWEVRQTDDGFRTYSEKSTGTVAWDSTRYQGSAKNIYTVSADNWYTVKTLFKTNSEGVAEKISYYLYDSNGNLLVSLKDETIKNDSLKISSIADLSAAMPASSSKQDLIPNGTFDIDNVSIKDVTGKNTVSIVEDEFKVERPEVKLQLAEKPDDVSLLNSITCVNNADNGNVGITASFDSENNRIVIVPNTSLPAGEYKITLPATLTVAGSTLAENTFIFDVYNSQNISFDFEDGTAQGWLKGSVFTNSNADLSVQTEEGNSFLRLETIDTGAYIEGSSTNNHSTLSSKTPDAYVKTNYILPQNCDVMVSVDFRYSDTSLRQESVDKGSELITYYKQFLVNSYKEELPYHNGNIYMPWVVRKDNKVSTYSKQTDDLENGSVWWDKTVYQGAGAQTVETAPDTWYTIKTVYKTNGEGVAEKISYYLYDSVGNVLYNSVDEDITNVSLKIDSISDLSIALLRSKVGEIPNSTYDIDNVSIKAVENSLSVVSDKAVCTYTNLNALSEDVMCIIAAYEKAEDGSLILKNVKIDKERVLPGKTASLQTEAVSKDGCDVCKAFLWNGELVPVCTNLTESIE